MTPWVILDPSFHPANLGYLPDILSNDDPRSVKEQINDRYRHGGGWRSCAGFTLAANNTLRYPGDPPFRPCAATTIGEDLVIFYFQGQLLAVIHPDRTFEVTRVD